STTAVAVVVRKNFLNLELARKLIAPGPAVSRLPMLRTRASGSPRTLKPKRTASSPKVSPPFSSRSTTGPEVTAAADYFGEEPAGLLAGAGELLAGMLAGLVAS